MKIKFLPNDRVIQDMIRLEAETASETVQLHELGRVLAPGGGQQLTFGQLYYSVSKRGPCWLDLILKGNEPKTELQQVPNLCDRVLQILVTDPSPPWGFTRDLALLLAREIDVLARRIDQLKQAAKGT